MDHVVHCTRCQSLMLKTESLRRKLGQGSCLIVAQKLAVVRVYKMCVD